MQGTYSDKSKRNFIKLLSKSAHGLAQRLGIAVGAGFPRILPHRHISFLAGARVVFFFKILLFAMIIALPYCKSKGSGVKKDGEFTDAGGNDFSFLSTKYNKKLNIAVVEFSGEDGTFSTYNTAVTDEVIRRVSREKNTTLIERSRLDTILKEQSIQQSGLISPENSVQIGKVIPVDIIVSGTYRRDKGNLIVKGRLTNTVTGEIIRTFKFAIPIEIKTSATTKVAAAKGCEGDQNSLVESLMTSSTAEHLEAIAKKAVKIPFFSKCGPIHYEVINRFVKSEYYPESYHNFLYETLDDEDSEKLVRQTSAIKFIFRYFSADKNISSGEWNTAKKLFLRKLSFRQLLYYFVDPVFTDEKSIYKRVDDLMDLAIKKEFGRPYAIPAEKIAYEIISVGSLCKEEPGINIALYIFSNYHPEKSEIESFRIEGAGWLAACFQNTKRKDNQKLALDYFIEFYKNEAHGEKAAEELWQLIKSVTDKIEDEKKSLVQLAAVRPDATHLERINKDIGEWICYIDEKNTGTYMGQEVQAYVLRNKIKCGANSRGIDSLLRDLESGDAHTKDIALETLAKVGEAAKPAEKKAIQCLKLPGSSGLDSSMKKSCVQILGNIKTENPLAIRGLIDAFSDQGYAVSDEAMNSVVNIGKPAVPALAQSLRNHQKFIVRMRCAIVLGRIGKDARYAIPSLNAAVKNDPDSDVREQAEGALIRIGK